MTAFFAGLVCLVVGIVLGVTVEWKLLRPWVKLAMKQSEVLHGPNLAHTVPGLLRTFFQAADGDDAARSRIGAKR